MKNEMVSADLPLIQIAMVVLHHQGRVLLQHRDNRPDVAWPGHWGIFGGHIDDGETPLQAARREMREELGVELGPELDLVYRGCDGVRERHIFLAELPLPPDELVLNEGQGMALYSLKELSHLQVAPHHRAILRAIWRWMKETEP